MMIRIIHMMMMMIMMMMMMMMMIAFIVFTCSYDNSKAICEVYVYECNNLRTHPYSTRLMTFVLDMEHFNCVVFLCSPVL